MRQLSPVVLVGSHITTTVIFIYLAVYTVRSDSTNATTLPCGDGWVSYNNYCYLFNNKKWINRDQAADECDQRDGSLLYLSNMDELVCTINN